MSSCILLPRQQNHEGITPLGYSRIKSALYSFARYWRNRRPPLVLSYHRVATLETDPWSLAVSPPHFSEQLNVISRRYTPVSLRTIARAIQGKDILPSRAVAVTFDDGYADNLIAAEPTLRQYRIPATFFITTGFLDASKESWWDDLERVFLHPGSLPGVLSLRLDGELKEWSLNGVLNYTAEDAARHSNWRAWDSPPTVRHEIYLALWKACHRKLPTERQRILNRVLQWANLSPTGRKTHRFLTTRQLQALVKDPLFEAGAHTVTHPVLPSLAEEHQRQEILESKQTLESVLNTTVKCFAYPHGAQSAATSTAVYDAGFSLACTTDEAPVFPTTSVFHIPRCNVQDWDRAEFIRRLAIWEQTGNSSNEEASS